ncbi:MAG TPA: xanthine dehydrogenase family protein subunit M [Symbiobacteriaceae bacterium]|nr:xanthine dehydrogenase family protein subunit M [Symbiobacteriaceae bacterium]
MKPAPFSYVRPESLTGALRFLAEHPDEAKPLAGGQSLLPVLNLRLSRIAYLVDITRIPGLAEIESTGDGGLALGGLVRHRELAASPLVRDRAPLLAQAASLIGHNAIRNRGTLGGSVAHADPAAELPAALVALEATVLIAGADGERECPAGSFFLGLMTTALAPGQLITGVRVPPPVPRSGWAYLECARRHGDFAMVGVAAGIALDQGGSCAAARLVFSGVGDLPHRAQAAEALLKGRVLTSDLLAEAARAAVQPMDPPSDLHASGSYRREVAQVYATRALQSALDQALASL